MKKYIYIGVIPDIFGYGINVASETEEECMKALKKAYKEWKQGQPDPTTNFKDSYERWGGRIEKVELNKNYYSDFGS